MVILTVVRLQILFFSAICVNCVPLSNEDTNTLQLVHMIFRHGDRTNDLATTYPKDPYINETYYPYGRGQITKKGKKTMYRLGQALRERYDAFLGKSFYPGLVEAWSTNTDRTKMSLMMVLAGLFPPTAEEAWESNLLWQPVPFTQLPLEFDKVLFSLLVCPNYKIHYKDFVKSKKFVRELDEHQELFGYLSEHTGLNVTDYQQVFLLFVGLLTEEQLGLKLPAWTRNVYPHPMKDLAVKQYLVQTATPELKRILSGFLLEKIINDTKSKLNESSHNGKKIILYSGHEINIAFLLCTLDVFYPLHIPPYGSYVLLEIHEINGVYGIKILYHDYTTSEPRALKLPGCDQFCDFNKFISLVEEYLPTDSTCGIQQNCHFSTSFVFE